MQTKDNIIGDVVCSMMREYAHEAKSSGRLARKLMEMTGELRKLKEELRQVVLENVGQQHRLLAGERELGRLQKEVDVQREAALMLGRNVDAIEDLLHQHGFSGPRTAVEIIREVLTDRAAQKIQTILTDLNKPLPEDGVGK